MVEKLGQRQLASQISVGGWVRSFSVRAIHKLHEELEKTFVIHSRLHAEIISARINLPCAVPSAKENS